MKFIKIFSLIFVLSAAALYISGCSSAEQTTGKLAYAQGDYKKAEVEFEKETQKNAQNEEAWFYLAMSRAQQGKLEGTKSAIEQYRSIGKKTFNSELTEMWGTMYDRGYNNFKSGENLTKTDEKAAVNKYNDALNNFQIAYTLLPDSAFVKQNIDAINNRINTILVKPLIDKGVAFEKEGNYEAAISEYKNALDKITKSSGAYEVVAYDIAVANLKWGEKMREANSEDPAYKAKYEAALPYLEELTGSADKDTKITAYDLLIQVYANLGMTDKATDAMKMRDKLKAENK